MSICCRLFQLPSLLTALAQNLASSDYVSKDDDYAFSLERKKIHGIVTSAGFWKVESGNTVVETDTWHHTALTYDSSTQMLILYLDGEVDAELSVPAGVEHRNGGPLTIGTLRGRGYNLIGKLDDIKIFDEALTQGQIKGELLGGGFPFAYAPTPKDMMLYPRNLRMTSINPRTPPKRVRNLIKSLCLYLCLLLFLLPIFIHCK